MLRRCIFVPFQLHYRHCRSSHRANVHDLCNRVIKKSPDIPVLRVAGASLFIRRAGSPAGHSDRVRPEKPPARNGRAGFDVPAADGHTPIRLLHLRFGSRPVEPVRMAQPRIFPALRPADDGRPRLDGAVPPRLPRAARRDDYYVDLVPLHRCGVQRSDGFDRPGGPHIRATEHAVACAHRGANGRGVLRLRLYFSAPFAGADLFSGRWVHSADPPLRVLEAAIGLQ